MEDTFNNLATYGYIGLFLYSLGGGFVALVGAGVLSYMGKMDIGTSIAVAFVANALGDVLLFYMARYQKSMMMEGVRKHRRKLALSHIMMKKYEQRGGDLKKQQKKHPRGGVKLQPTIKKDWKMFS